MSRKSPLALLLVLILAACSAPPVPTVTLAPTATATHPPAATPTAAVVPQTVSEPSEGAQVRIVQAASQSGALDVYLGQALIAAQLGLGAYTNPVTIAAGDYPLRVVPAGSPPEAQALAQTSVILESGHPLLVLITGTPDALTIATYQEDLSPMPSGQARLSFIHAVPRGPAATPHIDENLLSSALDFGQSSPGQPVEAGTHTLAFWSGDTLLADLQVSLAARQTYTAVLVGQVGGGQERILLFGTPVQMPGLLRFIHAAPDLPTVDVFLDDQPVATALDYRRASDWLSMPARSYRLRVIADGASPQEAPLAQAGVSLMPDQGMQAVLLQAFGVPTLRIFAMPLVPTLPTSARLIAFNAAPDSPLVYAINNAERFTAIPPVAFGMATNPLDVPAGTLNLAWQSGDSAETRLVEIAGEYTFTAGRAYTYVVTGADDDPLLLADEVGISEAATTQVETIQVRVVNALAQPLDVRVTLNAVTLDERLARGSASDYVAVPHDRDAYSLLVEAAGVADSPTLYSGDLTLQGDELVSIFVYGPANAVSVLTQADYDRPIPAGQTILRVFHAAPEHGEVYVSAQFSGLDPTPAASESQGTPVPPLVPGARFQRYQSLPFGVGAVSEFIGLPPGNYDVQILRGADSALVTAVSRATLSEGVSYDLLLLPGETAETLTIAVVAHDAAP